MLALSAVTVPKSIQPFVPDVAAALPSAPEGVGRFWGRIELSARDPDEVRPFAVVLLRGRLVVREVRTDREEVAVDRARVDPRPDLPAEALEHTVHYRYVSQVLSAESHACSMCKFSPGRLACATCGGTGLVGDASGHSCYGCRGAGESTCGVCDGRIECAWVDLVYLTDRAIHLNQSFMPASMEGPIWQLAEALCSWEAEPEALAVGIESRVGSGPYRDAPTVESDFYGYRYDNALERGRATALQLRATAVHESLTLLTVPVVEVTWRSFARVHRALLYKTAADEPRWVAPPT